MNAALHVLCGLPASGKSTLAAHLVHAECGGTACVVSADEIRTEGANPVRVFAWVYRSVEAALGKGCITIVDTCALRPFERMRLLAIGRRAGARCVLDIVTTDWSVCVVRDRARPQASTIHWPNAAEALRVACTTARREGWDAVRMHDGGRTKEARGLGLVHR